MNGFAPSTYARRIALSWQIRFSVIDCYKAVACVKLDTVVAKEAMMGSNRHLARTYRGYLCPLLLAVGWIACVPMEAGAQVATELVSRPDSVPDSGPSLVLDSLSQDVGSNGQIPTPASSAADKSRTANRDSIKNGLLIGAAVAAVLSVYGTRIADCPDSAEGSCPGTKALGIAITVATGAAIGAGIDLLFSVDAGPGAVTPTGLRRDIIVAGRIRW